jgi:hypothetical protein
MVLVPRRTLIIFTSLFVEIPFVEARIDLSGLLMKSLVDTRAIYGMRAFVPYVG